MCGWEDNIKTDLIIIVRLKREDGIHLPHDRDKRLAVVNTVMNLWVPQNMWDLFSS